MEEEYNMIKNDEDYLISRTYTNYGGVNMAFDLSDEELQATREMNKTAWESEIDKWSKEYLIERYKDLEQIEKEHKKENGELRKRVEELETAYLLQKDRSIELATTIDALTTDYKEEKEKNKELENADLTTVYMNGFYDGEKKWKDKIKYKIEELDRELQLCEKQHIDTIKAYTPIDIIKAEIIRLQELLEERN